MKLLTRLGRTAPEPPIDADAQRFASCGSRLRVATRTGPRSRRRTSFVAVVFSFSPSQASCSRDEVDYVEILRVALRNRTCAVCGIDLDHREIPRAGFCSRQHFYKWRDARRYADDPEGQRERSRAYYRANRETVLEKAAAKRGRPRPPELTECSECGDELTGRQRITCGKAACRDRRFKRTNPEAYAERERQKVERRREKRRATRAENSS